MLGRKERDQLELFMTGSLRQLVPDDHVLVRVDQVLDLSWLRSEVADLYCETNGRRGVTWLEEDLPDRSRHHGCLALGHVRQRIAHEVDAGAVEEVPFD